MDLIFQPRSGSPFYVEVGYFDTILEIKEKIQKDKGIPIADQTLIFNGNILQDELNVHNSDILDRSRIDLLVPSEEKKLREVADESLVSSKVKLLVKMPSPKVGFAVEMDINDTIIKLKDKIHERDGIPVGRMAILANGIELNDHKSLKDCELSGKSEVDVIVRSSPAPATSRPSSGNVGGSRKLRIFVLTKCGTGTEKIPLEVNYLDNVVELRKKLQAMNVDLPQEGYFFIYKQIVMDDDRSFRWHQVCQGDTVEIFSGSVSGGS
ncbi:Ubiquitin-like protein [Handroanthus impetiginosus]|uniref:Ubiquitin-like protein n=1 Tax=Handroanthus impetiginosus TaxID=429701 RepID=A0A2G9G3S6_9LAMI|nr:Ubiquitin-like protein [Handroanthus impetiginosus]